jgi:PAS domain S-box-containing protein
MKDQDKTKEQVMHELAGMRQRVAELEAATTEHKRVEEASQRQREELQAILDSVPALIFYKDKENRFIRVNRTCAEALGRPTEEIEGKSCFEIFPPDQAEDYWRNDKEVMKSGRPRRSIVEPLETPEGTRWVQTDKILYRDEEGNIIGVIGFAVDITERKWAEEEIQQRTAQLEALRQVGLEITSELDLDALLHSIVSRAVELVDGDSGGLYLYRPGRDVLEWAMAVGPHLASIGAVLQRGEGLSGKVWETGLPLIVEDYQRWEGRAALYEGYPFKATVGVPVRWGGEFLGVLNVLADPPHTFSPADAELLSLFATHAAIAIENARLYESERKRSAELEALHQAGLRLTSTLELQPILEVILDHTLKVLDADDAHIFLYDGERLAFGAALWADGHRQTPYAEPRSQGLTYTVARSGEPIVIPDVNSHSLFQDYQWGGAIVGLPLHVGGRVVGVMNVAFKEPRAFDESELRILGLLADQAAIAIKNARLYTTKQQLAQERGILLDIARATTSTLDMKEVLKLVTQRAAQACGADRCTILLLDEEGKTLTPAMSQLASGRLHKEMWQLFKDTLYPRPLAEVPEARQVLQEGCPLFIPDALTSSLPRHWIEPFNVKSLLIVPMISKGRPIGVMGLDRMEKDKGFTAEQANLAMTIGAQAAIAIENARLYEETRQRVAELGTLYDVATAAAASIRLDETLNCVMAALQEIMHPDDVAILLLEPETDEVVIRAHSGFPGGPTLMRRPIGVGIPGWVVQTGEPVLLADVRQDERYHPCDPDTRSEICVPLRVGERIIGAINLESHRMAAFSEEHLRLLSILAGHLAVVIENSRLFEEIEERRIYVEGVLGAAPDAIVTLDARHRIAEWNSGAERLFGYSREEVLGQDLDPLVTNPDVIEEATGFRQIVMGGEELPPVETVRYRKDGSPVDVLLAASPILVEGELTGVVTVYTDITERKRVEEELKDYSERLEEMVGRRTLELQKAYSDLRDSQARLIQSEKLAATGRLAVSVAHEINNPLQGISNYLTLISQQVAQDDPLHEDLDMVKLGFERISEIVRRLRAFYRPAGEEMEPTDINGVVERVLALVGHQLSLGQVEVKTEMTEHELPVLGSAGQLEQVLVNLTLNAQEAMPQGGELTVRTTLHDDVVQLQVSDTGQGISEEEMSRLFKPFYSGKGGKGLGLGLWISHNIVEGHGGQIEVESQVSEGTTFTISLPAYQRDKVE